MDLLVDCVTGRFSRRKVNNYLRQNLNDLANPYFWIEIVVEFILCAFTLTIVIWALTTLNTAAYKPGPTHFGLFAGFVIMSLLEGWGPLCGAPLNPAGTWGFFVAGRISLVRALLYMGAEISGAATGGMIGISLTPSPYKENFKPILPGEGVTIGQGLAIEAILTFNLLIVALTCTNPKQKTCIMSSFPIAFCIGTGIMSAGTHTGGLQNPIVPFGPAVATKNFYMHFPVYWAGPFIGSTVAAIFFTIVMAAKERLTIHRFPPPEPETKDEPAVSQTADIELRHRRKVTSTYDNIQTNSTQQLVLPASSSSLADISTNGSRAQLASNGSQYELSRCDSGLSFGIDPDRNRSIK